MIFLGLFATQLQGLLWIAKNANQLSLSRLVVSTSHGHGLRCASHNAFPIVPWDNRSSKAVEGTNLHPRSVARRTAQDADPLGKGDQFRYGSDLHFLHHPVAVGLNGALGRAQRVADLLVRLTANDEFEDLPLARR